MIDFLKVFAALLIILHHLSSYGQIAKDAHTVLPLTMAWLFEYKRYAVQIFLVMAGYLAAQSLSRLANMRFKLREGFWFTDKLIIDPEARNIGTRYR